MELMTDIAAPAAPVAAPAPVAPLPNAGKPTFNHTLIPPLRTPKAAVDPMTTPPMPGQQNAAPDAQPDVVAKDAPVEPEKPAADPSVIEYAPDDEFTVVVNGKEQNVTLGKLMASYQRNEAANAKFADATAMRAQANDIVAQMMTPEGFVRACKQARVDPYEIADRLVVERYDYEQMSPEQREIHDFKREKAAYEERQKREAQTVKQQQEEQQVREFQARFIDGATSTMDRLGVPADPDLRNEIVRRAAGIFRDDFEAGYQTTSQAATQDAWTAYQEALDRHTRALPVDRRVTAEERATLAAQQTKERVRVAQAAPKAPNTPRAEDGRFVARKPTTDWSNPYPQRR